MLRSFSPAELDRMKATQESAMMDECQILTYAAGVRDSFGEFSSPTYTAQAASQCGFMSGGGERETPEKIYLVTDAQIRLPVDSSVNTQDRIRITKRFGTAINPVDFEVFGAVVEGPSGIVVKVKKVDL